MKGVSSVVSILKKCYKALLRACLLRVICTRSAAEFEGMNLGEISALLAKSSQNPVRAKGRCESVVWTGDAGASGSAI